MKTFRKVNFLLIFIIGSSFLLNSCATLFKGSTEEINFSSEPAGAKVYVNGMLLGTSPVQLELKSNKVYNIEFKKEGFETRTVVLNNSVGAGWIVLDILGGVIPIIVDAATGDWYKLDQEHVNAILEKKQ